MTEQRFDHLWRETLTNHASMVRHANGARTALRLLRRAAYRFTVKILEIQDRYPNEFVAHATSTNKDVEDWMEEHFAPIESFGDDRRQLMCNIRDGMTEREYIDQFTAWGPKKRARERTPPLKVDTIANLTAADSRSDAEKINQFGEHLEAVISENRELRRDNARLLRENEQLRKDFDRLDRLVQSRKRKIA
jgi:hypothetical protein